MAPDTVVLDRCRGCGSELLTPLALRYEFEGARYPLVACLGCGLRFLRVQPAGAALAALYSREYFEVDFRCGRSDAASGDEAAFRDENRGLLDAFVALGPPGRFLEVGCAFGWLLHHARERGFTPQGVELSPPAVAHARGLGLDVVEGTLEDARFDAGRFDLVYLGDVLEHVPDPRATLVEIARVLRPGGHLVLRGPITTHALARRLGLALYEVAGREIVLHEPPYHLWEFTPGPLRRLFERTGFRVLSARQSKIPPGRVHGRKTPLQRTAMAVLDSVNEPLTRLLNVWGDRIVVTARRV